MTDWYSEMLKQRENDGAADAEKGRFNWPYPASDDPNDEDENLAYSRGFDRRRRELGDKFEWCKNRPG